VILTAKLTAKLARELSLRERDRRLDFVLSHIKKVAASGQFWTTFEEYKHPYITEEDWVNKNLIPLGYKVEIRITKASALDNYAVVSW
jgi:hypothetical protein